MADLRIGVLTCSDSCSCGDADDLAGRALIQECEARDWIVVAYHVCADEVESIATSIIEMAELEEADVVLTLGGTSLGPRDFTPEATELVCDRMVPGIAEVVRHAARSADEVFLLSRATAGIREHTLVINLPGGEAPTAAAFAAVAEHLTLAVEKIKGECP